MNKLLPLTLCAPLAALGCQGVDEHIETETVDLELENGGISMTDEAPMFDDVELFESSDLSSDQPYTDPMSDDPEVEALEADPDAALFHALIVWGQLPPNPENETGREWSGTLSVNRGALIVRHTVAFEPDTDSIVGRSDRRSVQFTSWTRPHHDGMALSVIDPTPFADEPLTLTYTPQGGEPHSVAMAELLDRETVVVDDAGNRLAGIAMVRPLDVCDYGFIRGRWHRTADDRGRFIGRVGNQDGELVGHVRGAYGKRVSGEQVFFGKYINLAGEFRGIFGGRYDAGRFVGRWKTREGEHGALRGMYRETIPGPETGGVFLGRWAQKSCNLDLGPDEQP